MYPEALYWFITISIPAGMYLAYTSLQKSKKTFFYEIIKPQRPVFTGTVIVFVDVVVAVVLVAVVLVMVVEIEVEVEAVVGAFNLNNPQLQYFFT